jgi:MFS family permease
MGNNGINPYESPLFASERQSASQSSSNARGLLRVLVMGLIGYGAFAGVGVLYFVVAEILQLEIFPTLRWAMGIGVIGAAIFAGSEVFNSGRGSAAGFLPRMLGAVGVFMGSGIASSWLSGMLGWRPRGYEDEGHWLKELVLAIGVYCAGLVLARVVWIGGTTVASQEKAADKHG